MKALNFIKRELRESLLKGINRTIDSLKDVLPADGNKHQSLLLLELRLKEINNKVINGTISEEQSQLAKNKIRESLIQFINELKDDDLGFSSTTNVKASQVAPAVSRTERERKNSGGIHLPKEIIYGLMGILVIVLIWAIVSQFPSSSDVTTSDLPATVEPSENPIAAAPSQVVQDQPQIENRSPATKPVLRPEASFVMDPTSCQNTPCDVRFSNKSTNAEEYDWDFGDGESSTSVSPTHRYNEPGIYKVTLTAINKQQKGESQQIITVKEETEVRDQNGNRYAVLRIGGNRWTATNLDFDTRSSWYYDNVRSNRKGRLYHWDTARQACENLGAGWRLPTVSDWEGLLRSYSPNDLLEGGTSGLNLVAGGCRSPNQVFQNPETAYYWTGTGANKHASFITLGNGNFREWEKTRWAFSCRCVKSL